MSASPPSESVAFKEWQVICDALACGRQSILLRKGGIHEGRRGFSFAHEAFFLFPTHFHAQEEHVREGEVSVIREWQAGDPICIKHHAEAVLAVTLTDWKQVEALLPWHIYSEKTVRDRFDWQGKGMASGSIHLAVVRVRELANPWEFPYQVNYGGCRSWLTLPDVPCAWRELAKPVIDDEKFAGLLAGLDQHSIR